MIQASLALVLSAVSVSGCGAPDENAVAAEDEQNLVDDEFSAQAVAACPKKIIHKGPDVPGEIENPREGADCDGATKFDGKDIRGGAIACDGQNRRFVCVDKGFLTNNPNNHAGTWKAAKGKFAKFNNCELKISTEFPPPSQKPFVVGHCK
jgi:hypothetical protein